MKTITIEMMAIATIEMINRKESLDILQRSFLFMSNGGIL